MARVNFEGVSKAFDGTLAVDDLHLDVHDGELLVLLGPSGCGKTTALRIVAGLEDPTAGTVSIGDVVVNDVEPKDRDVAMVFQSYALYPHMTLRRNIEFPLRQQRVPAPERARRVEEAADTLGLGDLLDRKPGQLSGGQRQRVALARAIVRDPQVFLMDEPLSNLDATLRIQTRADIVSLQRRLGTTTIYVTHDQVEAMTMGHRVAVMRLGELLQIAPPQDLYDNPDNLFVAGFIGTPPMTLMHAGLVVDGDSTGLRIGSQFLPIPRAAVDSRPQLAAKAGEEIVVGMRAEDIYPEQREGTHPLAVTVVLSEALGSSVHLTFALDGTPVDEARLGSGLAREEDTELTRLGHNKDIEGVAVFPPRLHFKTGDPITVFTDSSRLHYFDVESGRALR